MLIVSPTMSSTSELHRCSICLKCYKRREHLQRHTGSHSSARPYHCPSCNGTFQRADVLRRHLKTCDGQANKASATSTKRRACDRCVNQKKACSSGKPCQNCQKRSLLCSYSCASNAVLPEDDTILIGSQGFLSNEASMLSDDCGSMPLNFEDRAFDHFDEDAFGILPDFELSDYPGTNWLDFINVNIETQAPRGPRASYTNSHEYSFPFLDSFTSQTGFVSSFDCGSLAQREEVLAAVLRSLVKHERQNVPDRLASKTEDSRDAAPLVTAPLSQSPCLPDPLSLKTQEIILLVKEVATVKPRNSAVTMTWSPSLEENCSVFFSPTNLQKFLELYWAIWHPNVNFVHRPTFNPGVCKSILLASMALIGACVSPDPADNEAAKIWFNCVEEMVFIDDDFCSDMLSTDTAPFNPVLNRRKIEALQAAYMVILYQNWEGTDASKRRMRRYRYSNVVSTARDFGISGAKHVNYSQQSKQEFSWGEFVAREELIRTFLWIFLLDHAFTIFNNLPPRMVIKEMKMHMAFPESCFQAATKDECYGEIQCWISSFSPTCYITLLAAVEDICERALVQDTRRNLARLGPLNLFAMVSVN
ncbi:hypothetical protein L207DRAFT_566531 [Hyaloscypha variabilis F]|uniref:Uncharacterized protein n=1 Tax=Hyaloscypha variabilis (strain UAMH 11265 / GT02V1 / F) TaxID=1149755 RepID=A0A2J6RM40_HYAVF|nr:hypothetical protein L207DRAFT_566531 [Hyaloscypha variabilis F]